MRRRTGRPNSASSLHILASEVSGVNNGPRGGSGSSGPRVVVQSMPEVGPAEERLTPAPTTLQADTTAPTIKQENDLAPVRTRLRPHRSSWRDKYSPSEVKEVKDTSSKEESPAAPANTTAGPAAVSPAAVVRKPVAVKSVPAKPAPAKPASAKPAPAKPAPAKPAPAKAAPVKVTTRAAAPPKPTAPAKPVAPAVTRATRRATNQSTFRSLLPVIPPLSPESKKDRRNYPSEDVASIERNLQLQRDRTPSTDSAPESPAAEKVAKFRSRRAAIAEKTAEKTAVAEKTTSKRKTVKEDLPAAKKPAIEKMSQPNGKHAQAGQKEKVVTPSPAANTNKKAAPQKKEQEKPAAAKSAKEPTTVQVGNPVLCESTGFVFLDLEQPAEKPTDVVSPPPTAAEVVGEAPPVPQQPTPDAVPLQTPQVSVTMEPTEVQSEITVEADVEASSSNSSGTTAEEAFQIAKTVSQDGLIQRFGVRLLGMSLDPQQKILAVSQRMIELVRLLRAAQGLDPSVQCLSQLIHCDNWPLLTEAIMYVAGYQEDDGTYRNTNFVFDVGQALKFLAHILKDEALATNNKNLERDMKTFMASIDGVINGLLPNTEAAKHIQIFAADQMDGGSNAADDMTDEERHLDELINTLGNNAVPQTMVYQEEAELIVPDLLAPGPARAVAVQPAQPALSRTLSAAQTEAAVRSIIPSSPEKREGTASVLLELSKSTGGIRKTMTQKSVARPPVKTVKKLTAVRASATPVAKPTQVINITPSAAGATQIKFVKICTSSTPTSRLTPPQRRFSLLIPSNPVKASTRPNLDSTARGTDRVMVSTSQRGAAVVDASKVVTFLRTVVPATPGSSASTSATPVKTIQVQGSPKQT